MRAIQITPSKSATAMQQPLTAPMPIYNSSLTTLAQVAELVDALASGASVCMDVEVRVLSWAPNQGIKSFFINHLIDFSR